MKQRGFTIIEMLVAIGVTVLMLSMIFVLFMQTQTAVSTGLETGEALVGSEVVANQLQRDAQGMRPPVSSPPGSGPEDGILVIAQKIVYDDANGNGAPDRGEGPSVTLPNDETRQWPIRSDQLAFIADADFSAATPQHPGDLASTIRSGIARIWYGHAIRAGADGTAASPTLAPIQPPNENADRWVMARHALLLADSVSGFDPANDTHANGAAWSDDVLNTATSIASPMLHHSLTDVTNQAYAPDTDPATVLGEILTAGYPAGAYSFTIPATRPHLNTSPHTAGDDRDYIGENFKAWRSAQMHVALAANVSDIVIEFAGDYDDDSDPTTSGPPDAEIDKYANGNIRWYSYWFNNAAQGRRNHADPTSPLPHDATEPTTYDPPSTLTTTGTGPENVAHYDTSSAPTTAHAVFVFRHDDDDRPNASTSVNSRWPYLIRFRYRAHGKGGQIAHANSAAATDGVDNDGDGRIDERDERVRSGQWFEHVIQVNRPLE